MIDSHLFSLNPFSNIDEDIVFFCLKSVKFSKSISFSLLKKNLLNLSRRFKKFKKIRLGSKLLLSLIYGSGFRIEVASIFQQNLVRKTGLILYFTDFHSWNWRILGFDDNKTQHWALFFTKTKQCRLYFHWAYNSLSRAEDLAAVNHVTQAVVRVGSKIGS